MGPSEIFLNRKNNMVLWWLEQTNKDGKKLMIKERKVRTSEAMLLSSQKELALDNYILMSGTMFFRAKSTTTEQRITCTLTKGSIHEENLIILKCVLLMTCI